MNEPVLGIDLGTSNCVLATVADGVPTLIPSRSGGWLTPSAVAFHENQFLVGSSALEVLNWFPQRVATATKRYIGQRFTPELAAASQAKLSSRLVSGPSEEIRVALEHCTLPLTQVSALILGELFLDAQKYWGRPVRKAVITVPANFDDGQRQATKEAAVIAGFDLLRIVNEPTAAALAFGLARQFTGRALVFDLGGGTLDVTVLDISSGVFEVRATGGHPQLGGEDFDTRIVGWLLDQMSAARRSSVENDPLAMRRLRTAAEQAKRNLSKTEAVSIEIGNGKDGEAPASLSRQLFEELSEPLWQKCVDVCGQVLADAHLEANQIDAVLLVGGMTRVPRVRQLLTTRFGREPEHGVSPDEVVAFGAAIQASQIGSTSGETLLLDVASHSLGVGFAGKRVRRLIARNASIPVRAEQCFMPANAAQTEVVIPIFQGEGDFSTDCTKLGEVRLTHLSGSVRGDVSILVGFELATDGTLSVRAHHPNTKEVTTLRILARTDLPAPEVARLRIDQDERMAKQTKVDRKKAFDAFRELVANCEKLLASDEAAKWDVSALEGVGRLVGVGREALESEDWEKVATLARSLPRIIRAAQKQFVPDGERGLPVHQEAGGTSPPK